MFRNEIFVSQIAKARGIESEIRTDVARSILVILENQTLSLIENAAKFARQFNREELEFSDLRCALQEMGDRTELWNEESTFIWRDNSFIRKDPIVSRPDEYLGRQMKELAKTTAKPVVKGRWLYLEGKVPVTEENAAVKTLDELRELRHREIEEQYNKFNILRDRQYSLLTKEQEEFLQRVLAEDHEQGLESIAQRHNIICLVPFIVHYVLSAEPSEKNVRIVLCLLRNPYLSDQLEFNGHQIIGYLLGYHGPSALEAGLELGRFVRNLFTKYPLLAQVGDYIDSDISWPARLKKLGWCLSMGGRVNVHGLA